MGALTVDHSSHGYEWSDLVRLWEETDAPEEITSPPPFDLTRDTAEFPVS
ncbi:hypothetical protein [Streptomyces sp. NPDC003943]